MLASDMLTSDVLTSDVLVVGGGPAGAAAAYALAGAGHRVVVVERHAYPRPKTCGDALSPLAVAELRHLEITDAELVGFHRVDTIRLVAGDRSIERPWPTHPTLPDDGYVARRDLLDELIIRRTVTAGATLLDGHEAVAPIVERGFLRGALVRSTGASDGTAPTEIRARYTLVADGANSRFGRSLGTYRERSWPYATAIRGYWASSCHDLAVVEADLGLVRADGRPLTGYGWVFPLGDGTVNLGVGVLSTSDGFRSVNTTQLIGAFAAAAAERWDLDPGSPIDPPVSGRIPMGHAVGPSAGPTHLVVGDAAGAANPLTGAGIEYALATGRLAGAVLAEALAADDPTALQQYPRRLRDSFGPYFKVGRLLDRLGGRPAVMDRFGRAVVASPRIADAAIRIGTNEIRPWATGGAETIYRVLRAASRMAPDS